MSPRAKATAPRRLPTMADGSIPRAEQRVITPDGQRGVVVWSSYVETVQSWDSLVRLDGMSRGLRFATSQLRPEPS